jgi:hypothetical protein
MAWLEGTRVFEAGARRDRIRPGESWLCEVVDVDRRAILVERSKFLESANQEGLYWRTGPMSCRVGLDWAIQISRQYRKLTRDPSTAKNFLTLRPGKDIRQYFQLTTPPAYGTTLDPDPADPRYQRWFADGTWDPRELLSYGIPRELVD